MLSNIGKIFLGVLLVVLLTPQVHAASEAECAIWICLPSGFMPAECSAAHTAMNSRLARHMPPLPGFGECADKSDSSISYNQNRAAYVPAQQVCSQWVDEGESSYCAEYKTLPERYIKGQRCRRGKEDSSYPEGCTQTANYVDVIVDGKIVGTTYYWGQRGGW